MFEHRLKRIFLFALFLVGFLTVTICSWQPAQAISLGSIRELTNTACVLGVPEACSFVATDKAIPPTIQSVGAIGYSALADKAAKSNPLGTTLTEREKNFLRLYVGNIVDRVIIHYNAILANEIGVQKVRIPNLKYIWEPPTRKLTFGDEFGGQTFGLNIYMGA